MVCGLRTRCRGMGNGGLDVMDEGGCCSLRHGRAELGRWLGEHARNLAGASSKGAGIQGTMEKLD
jgi:hypothetical protein